MALSTKFYAPKRPPAFCETPVELVAGTTGDDETDETGGFLRRSPRETNPLMNMLVEDILR